MSPARPTPDPVPPDGGLSAESTPQVVVRAGKTYVCSSCGTLVEIPAEVVGQLVIAVESSPSAEDSEAVPTASTPNQTVASPPIGITTPAATQPAKGKKSLPARPRRPKRPEPVAFVGQTLDGLCVPSARQLDRALMWVSFHLKVLDRQGSERQYLLKRLKQRSKTRVPCPRPRGHANADAEPDKLKHRDSQKSNRAQDDDGTATARDPTNQRGPP
ncbi:hypothetical protein AB1K70_02265 [Bremerella sp. JC770]|uniref:hypothetical protein n=1 Tax=Bremerella sp. JC770 TaxID=3232137 RepID=UPI00345AB95C